jgi:hypothetical protein
MTTLRVYENSEKVEMKTQSVVTCALSMWYFVDSYGVDKRRGAAQTTLSGW